MHTPSRELFPPAASTLFSQEVTRMTLEATPGGSGSRRARDADDRRRRGQRPQGHARDPRRRADRHRDPAVLRPPAARPGRRLPPVPGRHHRRRQRPRLPQAAGLLHDRGRRRHGRQDPGHVAGRREGAARQHGVPADQPPARLPGVRQGRRVPAAEPGHDARAGRVAVHRDQADVPQADQGLRAGAARPRALRPVRPLHPVLRADRRRPVHRADRARRAAAGRHLRGGAVQLLLLGQHDPDLPRRRPHQRRLPLPRPARSTWSRRRRSPSTTRAARRSASTTAAARSCAASPATTPRSTRSGSPTRTASRSRTRRSPTGSRRRWCATPTPASSSRRRGRRRWPSPPVASPRRPAGSACCPVAG